MKNWEEVTKGNDFECYDVSLLSINVIEYLHQYNKGKQTH